MLMACVVASRKLRGCDTAFESLPSPENDVVRGRWDRAVEIDVARCEEVVASIEALLRDGDGPICPVTRELQLKFRENRQLVL
jgi:hypothetical protein